ncbi:packaged DNA stabilization protein gp10 [Deltaproteobacteria bacterium]|nr:packaged DNA stabilization protein gp10 [Deltaproteobacteria bacterium]
MQISILSGIYTDEESDIRTAFPLNLIPVPGKNGVSNGYLRPADGLVQFGTGPGIDRGGINWNDVCYRVMGTKLVSISEAGVSTVLGDVGGVGQVSLTYSTDLLAIASGGNLFYWDGATLTQVTDVDLGVVLDVMFVDGYFMTTDGTNLVVTDLNNPLAVDPFKYGSAEVDPDPLLAVAKLRNEVHAIGRYTIEVFQNVGGAVFPFQRINGGHIRKGSIGTHSNCIFLNTIAFLGSGKEESPSIYLGDSATAARIATREIDLILQEYTEEQLSKVVLEAKVDKGHNLLLIHLSDRTLVYDASATGAFDRPVWFVLGSELNGGQYRAKNLVWCYDKWLFGDPQAARHGFLSTSLSSHYGEIIGWEFGTQIIYTEGKGAIIHDLELVALPGRVELGKEPKISTSFSLDGETWSQEIYIDAGKIGNRTKRIVWFKQGFIRNWRIQRFRGTSDVRLSIARLEAFVEALNG